jgi:hypothetical protein
MHTTMLSKWDAITWTLVLAIVPYGWTVVGAMLMCWMVLQLGPKGGKVKITRTGSHTTIYGDISPRSESNRTVWKNFFDNEDF